MKLNALKPVELNDYTCFLLRKGMVLRKKHLELLFGPYINDKTRPEYIKRVQGSSYTGVKQDVTVPEYNYLLFKIGAPKIHNFFIQNPKQTLPASIINGLSDVEVRAAFYSGYLKHDSRGYYFTRNDRAMLEALTKNLPSSID